MASLTINLENGAVVCLDFRTSLFFRCFFVIEITDNGSNSLLALFFVDEFQGVDKIVAVGPIWIQIGPKIRS